MFLTVFDQFLVSFGLREVYMAPGGTPDLVEVLKNPINEQLSLRT